MSGTAHQVQSAPPPQRELTADEVKRAKNAAGYWLKEKHLENLLFYKYVGVDHSWVANTILQPFWRSLVDYLPVNLAPNMVTIIGFIFMVWAYFTTWWYCPLVIEDAPEWVYLNCAVCMFIYQTMDALDGKQARRTNTSSSLGELMDHGCDALTTMLAAISFCCCIKIGTGFMFYTLNLGMYAAFFIAQWEEYHTNVMELGYVGVSEGQLSYMATALITFLWGPDIWWVPIIEIDLSAISPSIGVFAITGGLILWLGNFALGSVGTILSSLYMILVKRKGGASISSALVRLFPGILILGSFIIYIYYSPGLRIFHAHLISIAIGFAFANLVGRAILARVTKQKFPTIPYYFLPFLILLAVLFFVSPDMELHRVYLTYFTLYIAATYLVFAKSIINSICEFLDIWAFFIKPKDTKSKQQ